GGEPIPEGKGAIPALRRAGDQAGRQPAAVRERRESSEREANGLEPAAAADSRRRWPVDGRRLGAAGWPRAQRRCQGVVLSSSTAAGVRVSGIRQTDGATVALDDISFEVPPGEIFGLIGPNGAGKTTTLECVEGLRKPDRGTIQVLDLDPFHDRRTLQNRIGVQLQEAQLQKRIKVWEAVDLWASLYRANVDGS